MKNKLPFLFLAMLMLVNVNVNAQTSERYTDNSKKHLVNANKFYNNKKTGDYSEYKTATLNIREKILYKDLKSTVNKNAGKYSEVNIYNNKNPNIDPKRQIYLFCSFKETKEKMIYKFIIIDAETQEPISEGNGESWYHH
ncbi:hypothetical protein [Peribacillus simplex]|uniref:PepSY domain-containing protein n=1 Tax=Peribacillus simplex NBRC 15720 = DSM 1321 TaxID=1349754 RepID=A0A223EJU9_9BACI|nr:hypothetical protein [Peribacillus simplex]ASS95521.1 hypothetical protein BS1321_17375 [Peribacillus simplex NBRC 15720 = DSM 1321]MEC1400775.1 hypothetical protein [Peribacillus simplex]